MLLSILAILLLCRLTGLVMRFFNQPQVVGEMLAGILLGPSVFGLIRNGAWMHALFPASAMTSLENLSQLGVVLFMFLVGLELDPKLLRGQTKTALVTGTAGIAVPFVLGAVLAMILAQSAPALLGPSAGHLIFCLFLGTAMSITAFPVLARILQEQNIQHTRFAALALACAALDDVAGWCILAVVLAIGSAAITLALTAAYVLIMLVVIRPLLKSLRPTGGEGLLVLILLGLLASSAATSAIGIHPIFGAFLFGAILPRDIRFTHQLAEKFQPVTLIFLLPLFFAFTGLRTELGLLNSIHLWTIAAIVFAVAVAGKFGGTFLAAIACRMSWRSSARLGVLMNTRGLMELIVLNIGLSLGLLSRELFSIMVLMALTTTLLTTPLMRLFAEDLPRTQLGFSPSSPA